MSKCAECEADLGVYEYNCHDGRVICDNCFTNAQTSTVETSSPKSSHLRMVASVLGIWFIYRLLFLIPSISSDEIRGYWEVLRCGDTLLQRIDFHLVGMRNASIMALGGTPYYLSILYFFFLAKFIPPLKRMVLDSSKRIRVRNIIMGTALFLTGVQSYFIASLNLSIWDI